MKHFARGFIFKQSQWVTQKWPVLFFIRNSLALGDLEYYYFPLNRIASTSHGYQQH